MDLSWPKWLEGEREYADRICSPFAPGKDLPLIMELNLPAALAVDILAFPGHHLVGHNMNVAVGLVAQELFEQGANDRSHAPGQNDDGHVVLLGPVVELLEVWVQLHVLLQDLDTFVERRLDAVEHFAEGIPRRQTTSIINTCNNVCLHPTGNQESRREPARSMPDGDRGRNRDCQSATVSLGRARKDIGHGPYGHCL